MTSSRPVRLTRVEGRVVRIGVPEVERRGDEDEGVRVWDPNRAPDTVSVHEISGDVGEVKPEEPAAEVVLVEVVAVGQ
jgi:hypothetical protein